MGSRKEKPASDDDDVAPGTEAGVKLPGGFEINTKGYHLGNLLQIVAAAILAVMALILYDIRDSSRNQGRLIAESTNNAVAKIATDVKADHDKLLHEMDKHNSAQEEMNYILTLSPTDRERLNLRMPESLRQKLIRER